MRFTSAKSNLNGYLSKTAVLIPTKLWDTFSDTLNVSECTCPKHVQALTTCPRMCPVWRTRLNMSRLRMDTLNVSRNMSNNMSSTTREFLDMLKHVHIFVWTCSNVSHRPDTFKHVQNMSDVTSVQKCFKKIYFNTNSWKNIEKWGFALYTAPNSIICVSFPASLSRCILFKWCVWRKIHSKVFIFKTNIAQTVRASN